MSQTTPLICDIFNLDLMLAYVYYSDMTETTRKIHYGPYIDYKKDNAVLILRKKGFSFREIAKEMQMDLKSVYRRYKRGIENTKITI